MLTAKRLEKMIELEEKLRAEYQEQLDAKTAEIETHIAEQEEQKDVIAKQLEQISTLSSATSANKHTEQLNRELNQRCDNLQEEVTTQKKRIKGLQKDLAQEREELKTLKQFDPAKMKKNLDAGKKKLAEKNAANDLLQKSVNKLKGEKAEQERQIKEMESKIAELEPTEVTEEAAEEAAA